MAFRWSQNASTVTITFPVAPSVKKSDVDVSVVNTILRAGVKGSVPLCEGTLTSPVKGFKWNLKAGIVSILLEKSMKVMWKDLLVPGRCKAVVKFDYTSRDPVELTIHVGDVITVLNEDSSGWWKGDLNGKIGLFPSNFTEVIEANAAVPEGPSEEPEPVVTPVATPAAPPTAQPTTQPTAQPPTQPPTTTQPPATTTASEGPASTGGPIRVPLVGSNDALMELRNKLASRANTVTSLEEAKEARKPEPKPTGPTAQQPTQPPAAQATKPVANFARALYEYTALEEGELSFQEGAKIEIMMRDDSGWWQGQCGDAIGWFPAEYVAEIPPSPSPSPTPPASAPVPAPTFAPVITVTPTPPAPAAAHTPAPAEDETGEDEEIREDDIIDLSDVGSSENRLVVPRRSRGGLRRKPSRSTLQRATAKALANASASRFDNEETKPVLESDAGDETQAPAGPKGPAPPPGEKKHRPPPPPAHALPSQPTLVRSNKFPPKSLPDAPTAAARLAPPSANNTQSPPPPAHEDEPEEETPAQPKVTIIKRPPPGGRPKVAPRKNTPVALAVPEGDLEPTPARVPTPPSATLVPPPASTPVVPSTTTAPTTRILGSQRAALASSADSGDAPNKVAPVRGPSGNGLAADDSQNKVAPVRGPSGNALSTSGSSEAPNKATHARKPSDSAEAPNKVTPAARGASGNTLTTSASSDASNKITRGPSGTSLNTSGTPAPPAIQNAAAPAPPSAGTRKMKPPPPALFTKQQTPLEPLLATPLSPTLSRDHHPPPSFPSPSTTPSTPSTPISTKWPPHMGTFQEFCTHITSLLCDTTPPALGIAPRIRARACVGVCTVDGLAFAQESAMAGDWEGKYFALGAASTPFVYCAAVDAVGLAQVRGVVREDGAYADVFEEQPHPYSTAGSIVMCGKLISTNPSGTPIPTTTPTTKIHQLMSALSGHHLSTNISSFFTLRLTANTDIAMAHYMKSIAHIDEKVSAVDALDVHFAMKSVDVDVKIGAALAASLAANGVCPANQKQCVPADVAHACVEMLPRIYLSDKEEEGIVGWALGSATILVVPNVLGLAIHSDDPAYTLKLTKLLAQKLHLVH